MTPVIDAMHVAEGPCVASKFTFMGRWSSNLLVESRYFFKKGEMSMNKNKNYFIVKLDTDSNLVTCDTPNDVYDLLKKKKMISVLRYNDSKTGRAYAKAAASQDLTAEEQEQTPVFIKTVLSDEGTFVKDEAFWIENYMLDEFYNPEQLPYIEEIIRPNGEISG